LTTRRVKSCIGEHVRMRQQINWQWLPLQFLQILIDIREIRNPFRVW
jgi:hypothetical protein